jgi:hypothetical protein
MTTLELGKIDLVKTDGTGGYRGYILMSHSVLVEDAHGIAFTAKSTRKNHHVVAFTTHVAIPQQAVKGLKDFRGFFKRPLHLVSECTIGVATQHAVFQRGRISTGTGILVHSYGQRLGLKGFETVDTGKRICFFRRRKLGLEALQKGVPFRDFGHGILFFSSHV